MMSASSVAVRAILSMLKIAQPEQAAAAAAEVASSLLEVCQLASPDHCAAEHFNACPCY